MTTPDVEKVAQAKVSADAPFAGRQIWLEGKSLDVAECNAGRDRAADRDPPMLCEVDRRQLLLHQRDHSQEAC